MNTYISNFVYMFYYQDFSMLVYNMIIIMAIKQVGMNVMEYVGLSLTAGRKINKTHAVFKEVIEEKQEEYERISNKLEYQAERKDL